MTDDQGQIIRGWTTKPSCGLVVYQHILKNGGMTVLALLRSLGWTVLSHRGHHDEKNGALSQRDGGLPQLVGFLISLGQPFAGALHDPQPLLWSHRVPRHLHRGRRCEEFGGTELRPLGSQERGPCVIMPPMPWNQSRVVVELHDDAAMQLWARILLPNLPFLRAQYSRAGCAMQVVTTLRQPSRRLMSVFEYALLPKMVRKEPKLTSGLHFVSLEYRFQAYLRLRKTHSTPSGEYYWADNQQAAQLTADECPTATRYQCHTRAIGGVQRCSAAPSIRLLEAQFDLVGVCERLEAFLWHLAARVGYFLESPGPPPSRRSMHLREPARSPVGRSRVAANDVPPSPPLPRSVHVGPSTAPLRFNVAGHREGNASLRLPFVNHMTWQLLRNRSVCDQELYDYAKARFAHDEAFGRELERLGVVKRAISHSLPRKHAAKADDRRARTAGAQCGPPESRGLCVCGASRSSPGTVALLRLPGAVTLNGSIDQHIDAWERIDTGARRVMCRPETFHEGTRPFASAFPAP